MDFTGPLEILLGKRSRILVLRVLLAMPEGIGLSGREIARRTGISHPTASSTLEELASEGVALVRRTNGSASYSLNRGHTFVRQVAPLFEWEGGLRDDLSSFLREEVRRHLEKIELAILFGSAVTAEVTTGSDIDLLIVTGDQSQQVDNAVERISDSVRLRFGNSLSPIVLELSKEEFLRKARYSRYRFWSRVLDTGVVIAGNLEDRQRGQSKDRLRSSA